MTARTAAVLPSGKAWAFEPKFDGIRACAWWGRDGRPRLQSRQQRSLTAAFPEIVAAIAQQLPAGTVLDGELVVWRDGRLDFPALLSRLRGASAPTVCLVAFDLLVDAGVDLRRRPHHVRRARLCERLRHTSLPLALVPQTTDRSAAETWLTDHTEADIEGVVAKRVAAPYTPHRPWQKIRTKLSDEAVVGGVIGPVCEPSALVLGRYDSHSRLRVAGRTAPLRDADRVVLGQLLQSTDEHPWPTTLRARFGEHRPLAYTRVRPDVVVELDVDTACDHGVWRHPALYRRPRIDLRPSDLVPV